MKRVDKASRTIRASEAAIYRALLDAEARCIWLPPKGMRGRIERFDASVGGGYRMVLTYKGAGGAAAKSSNNSDVVEARFVDLVPNKRVVEAIDFESDDAAFAGQMTMTWILVPVGGGTEVRIIAEDVPEGISAEDHQAGMSSSLRNLAEFCQAAGGGRAKEAGLPPENTWEVGQVLGRLGHAVFSNELRRSVQSAGGID